MGSINSFRRIFKFISIKIAEQKKRAVRPSNKQQVIETNEKVPKSSPLDLYFLFIIISEFIKLTFSLKIRLKIFPRIQICLLRDNSQNRIQTPSILISYFTIDNNSTSKINTVLGAIISPAPCSPYPNSEGINNLHLDPTGINCNASVQPGITWFTGKSAG